MAIERPGLEQIDGSGATAGQAPLWNGTDVWEPGDVVLGLTSADASVTITDNGDGTLDLAAAGGGGGGGGGGAVLASTWYNPATQASYSSTTDSEVDIDASNLAVTFTAPASGEVEVYLEGLASYAQTSASQGNWCLRSGTTLVASQYLVGYSTAGFTTGNQRTGMTFIVTGLTPGNSYTYKWAWRAYPSATLALYTGGAVAGGAYMRVSELA